MVTSIIPQDPARLVDDSLVIWSDDVVDPKLDNLVSIISNNQVICKEMIRETLSKVDVETMREKVKQGGKRKGQRQKQKEAPIQLSDESKIKSASSDLR